MIEFKMPSLGADMESGVLVEWMVKVGGEVKRGDVVAVVETDKGAIDVEIFHSGVIDELLVEPDTRVPVGTVLARLRGEEEEVAGTEKRAEVEAPRAEPTTGIAVSATSEVAARPSAEPSSGAPAGARVVASPRARKRAAQRGLSLEGVVGTGPQGSITAEDVERAATAGAKPRATEEGRVPGMRAAIAAAMSRSKREIPHYYLSHSIDLEDALRWLEARNAKVSVSERVLPIALLVRAVALALREVPELCGFWRDGGFHPSPGIHVGLAVSLRDGGLVDPAIHDADRGSLSELFGRIRDVTQRARHGQLRSSELSDAAITITSLGEQGVETVFGVIHPPQVAIVGFGTVAPRPWVVDGRVEARRVVAMSLSADHRTSDGHRGGRFIRVVEQYLQEPSES